MFQSVRRVVLINYLCTPYVLGLCTSTRDSSSFRNVYAFFWPQLTREHCLAANVYPTRFTSIVQGLYELYD